MLNDLFPNAPPFLNEEKSEDLRHRLAVALSMRPEVVQYVPVANICNGLLAEYYTSNPPTKEQPARWFIPLGGAVINSDFAQRKPDVVVVIRSLWEEYVQTQLAEVPITERREWKEWKEEFPVWQNVDSRVMDKLLHPERLHVEDLDPQLLRALRIHPPWECVVAIMEFKVSNSPDSTASTSTATSSDGTHTSNTKQKRTSRSKESSSHVAPIKKVSRSSSVVEGHTPPLASKASSRSQNGDARNSSALHASRKTLSPEVQLLSYFCEVMSAGRYRDWTPGAIINGMEFSLVACDREGAIKSAPTSLRTADGVDIFARWVLAVGSAALTEAGFSNIFRQSAGEIEGVDFSVPSNAKRASEGSIQLKFGKQHYQQYGAFGRGTTLYCVDITMGNKNLPGVCKISWPAATRENECDLIQQAREVDPIHVPEVICAWDVEESVLPSRTLRSQCTKAAVEHERRVLRVVVFPFYGPIHELEGDEFVAAFWDVMICTPDLTSGVNC
jgi:hypothetical protein